MNDSQIEQEIQSKGANVAPRITPADIEANIRSEVYFTAADGYRSNPCYDPHGDPYAALPAMSPLEMLTFCVLILRNGFTVTGESACASPENFNADIGRKIARQNAVAKIWPLMGYELRTKLHANEN
ncbi:MAG: Gp49 family protein [Afipia sp.]